MPEGIKEAMPVRILFLFKHIRVGINPLPLWTGIRKGLQRKIAADQTTEWNTAKISHAPA